MYYCLLWVITHSRTVGGGRNVHHPVKAEFSSLFTRTDWCKVCVTANVTLIFPLLTQRHLKSSTWGKDLLSNSLYFILTVWAGAGTCSVVWYRPELTTTGAQGNKCAGAQGCWTSVTKGQRGKKWWREVREQGPIRFCLQLWLCLSSFALNVNVF